MEVERGAARMGTRRMQKGMKVRMGLRELKEKMVIRTVRLEVPWALQLIS